MILLKHPKLGLFLAVLAAVSMWSYADFILVPYQKADAAAHDRPRGNLSDLYPRWLGARELLLHHRDPYSAEVTREIQIGYYGRPLDHSRPNDPVDQQGFAYPLYVVFLLAPTVHLPFAPVQAGFRWFLVLLTGLTVPLWLGAIRSRISATATLVWVVLVLGSFPAMQGLKLQQLTLLVCALLAGCAAALASGCLVLAGILLALATIKPQLVAIFAAWLMIWMLGDWKHRQPLAWSFIGTTLLLFAGAEAVLPGWVARFRAGLADYWHYTGGGKSVMDLALTASLGKLLAVLILLALAAFCWRMRREPVDSSGFSWTLSLVMSVTLVVVPMVALYNQLLLLPAFMQIVRSAQDSWQARLWQKGLLVRFFLILTTVSVLWPWLTSAILNVALLFLPSAAVGKAWTVPLYASLVVPLSVLGLVTVCVLQVLSAQNRLHASTQT